ncbi:hypothetical protein GWI33_010637 [Rhynchophorus ferrugineus]|uniref:Spaetzle domain-containing protein n=1 Tax=Rhynchophorus ferrugineus TaxID=354439 RepID=A0A834MKA0_RHYFE|nr:hypothetical protein GWI33_010637 [Rhynchophorus ferrugineus]
MDQHSWCTVVAFVLIAYITLIKAVSTERNWKGVYLPPPDPYYGTPYPEYQYRHYRDHKHYNPPEKMPSPQPMTATRSNIKTTTKPPEAMGEEDVPNYPYEDIRKFLEASPFLKQYFEETIEIGNRQGIPDELEGAESLCRTQTIKILYPKKLKNIQDTEVLVINDDKNYRQAIEYKKCVSDGACSIPFDSFGYTSTCVQQYDTKRLMVYQNSTKQIMFDQFKVPSCCTCMIKKV